MLEDIVVLMSFIKVKKITKEYKEEKTMCNFKMKMMIMGTVLAMSALFDISALADGKVSESSVGYDVDITSVEYYNMSYDERVDSFNIDAEILNDLSTEKVLELALDYPLGVNIFCFNTYEEGFSDLIRISTVYQELVSRDDLKECALQRYAEYEHEYDSDGEWLNKVLLESIIRYQLWPDMSFDERMDVASAHDGITNDIWADYIEELIIPYRTMSLQTENSGIPLANRGIAADGFTWGGTWAYPNSATYYVGFYQKYGKTCTCYKYYSGDYTSAEKTSIYNAMLTAYPNWTYSSPATKKYNCNSYVWISNDVYSNIYWLNDPTYFGNATSYFSEQNVNDPLFTGEYVMIVSGSGSIHSVKVNTSSTGTNMSAYMSSSYVQTKAGTAGLYVAKMSDFYSFYSGSYYVPYVVL